MILKQANSGLMVGLKTSLVLMGFTLFWTCSTTEVEDIGGAESAILAVIAADDSSFGIEDMISMGDEDYSLSKAQPDLSNIQNLTPTLIHDSTSIWFFGNRNMSQLQEVIVEVETDSSARALISHHVTGTFRVQQFERIWTSDTTWIRGDSIRFSDKPIVLDIDRRVHFRKRITSNGEEHWFPVAMTLAYGSTDHALEIEGMEWVSGDSITILNDFYNRFYPRDRPLTMMVPGINRCSVRISNDTADESELVRGHWGFHPRLNGHDLRRHDQFHFEGTLDNAQKLYTQIMPPSDRIQRYFRGSVEAIDHRTLFDHDYEEYNAAMLGFTYTIRRHIHD